MEVIIKEVGNRLDKALADLTELSRSQANEAIKAGTVLVNGKSAKAKYAVKEGDVITYELPEEEVLEYKAEDIPLDIIYEDADVAVVNKPQGMVVHPSAGHTSGTLVNALMYHVKDLSSINGVVRPGIVHRIDKDTSGLLMIAKNDKAHSCSWKQVAHTRFVCTWLISVTRWRAILFMGHARPSRAMDNFYMLRPLGSRILRLENWSNLQRKTLLFSRKPWRS